MPEMFPNITMFLLCALIMACAQLIYATVGFGAGMFAITLMAMLLPDLAGAVATLLLLTLVTEVWVLIHTWRHARLRLLAGLVPTMAVGLWLGTEILLAGNVAVLKRLLGAVVLAAGVWFLYQQRKQGIDSHDEIAPAVAVPSPKRAGKSWLSLPAGLASGLLGGMFGTGGPPVIIFFKSHGLDKSAFRATILWYFLIMSGIRGATYLRAGILTTDILLAALWLLPPSIVGILLGMIVHRRLSERHFAAVVSTLLMILGSLLLIRGGK